jgi:hypothetical protein
MKRQETDPLSGLRASPAPRELSGPVLEAAREALAARTTQTLWDRAWNSRGLRLAWVSATVGRLAAHVFVTIVPSRRRVRAQNREKGRRIMKQSSKIRRPIAVLAALGLVVVLTVTLAIRVAAQVGTAGPRDAIQHASATAPPPANVPNPLPLMLGDLPTPRCWGCTWAKYHPAEFQLDLDYLAPLGDGPANAALWFRDFEKSAGARYAEDYRARLVETDVGRVLPGDDPLLREAEPWVDQARCRFYPDVWEARGLDFPIPNLLFMLNLARAWVARGHEAEDRFLAKEDYRRAVRLGRLLRQDDVTIIQDLVAIACIRIGAEALYEEARREGDGAMMVATALVLTDKDAMRSIAARNTTTTEFVYRGLDRDDLGDWHLATTDGSVDAVVELAREVPDRRFRMDALMALRIVRHLGTATQREAVDDVLEELAASEDEMTAEMARLARDEPFSDEEMSTWLTDPD